MFKNSVIILVNIDGGPARIRIENLPNTNLDVYRQTNLPSVAVMDYLSYPGSWTMRQCSRILFRNWPVWMSAATPSWLKFPVVFLSSYRTERT
jgi:hypothetical protein